MGISREVPVKVNMDILLKAKLLIPEQLRDVLINQSLQVVGALFDPKQRHVLMDCDVHPGLMSQLLGTAAMNAFSPMFLLPKGSIVSFDRVDQRPAERGR